MTRQQRYTTHGTRTQVSLILTLRDNKTIKAKYLKDAKVQKLKSTTNCLIRRNFRANKF